MTERYLTHAQALISGAIISVLEMQQAEPMDAYKAMISIMAATINLHAGNETDARAIAAAVAAGLAQELLNAVEDGRAGRYETRP